MKRTVSAMEARRHLGEILEQVYYRGDEVTIMRGSRVMAKVIPVEASGATRRRLKDVTSQLQREGPNLSEAEGRKFTDAAIKASRTRRARRERPATSEGDARH